MGDAMRLEREHLLALALEGFQLAAVHFPSVNTHGTVKVLTNFYSAPLPVGVEVHAKVLCGQCRDLAPGQVRGQA